MPADPKPLETMAEVREALEEIRDAERSVLYARCFDCDHEEKCGVSRRCPSGERGSAQMRRIDRLLARIPAEPEEIDAATCEGCNTVRLGADLFTLDDGCRFCRECIDKALTAMPAESEGGCRPAPSDVRAAVCSHLETWARVYEENKGHDAADVKAIRRTFMLISKSSLLGRLIYGGEALRTEKCPKHNGEWAGLPSPWNDCEHGCQLTGWLPTPPQAREERDGE